MIGMLTMSFKFDAAHRLMLHKGACRNIHGHTWKVEVVWGGYVNEETGMLMDFADIKERVWKQVLEFLDHGVLVNLKDYDLKAFLKGQKFKYFEVLDGDPTCENISKMLFEQIDAAVPLQLHWVRVWESETAAFAYGGKEKEEVNE